MRRILGKSNIRTPVHISPVDMLTMDFMNPTLLVDCALAALTRLNTEL